MNLSRVLILGIGLAVAAVLLFVGLWWLLGLVGMSQSVRLFTALCVPPLVLLALLGGVALARRGNSGSEG